MLFSIAFWKRFGIDFGWILGGPNPILYCKNQYKTHVGTKSTFSKKIEKKLDFGFVFGGQSDEKSIKNDVEKQLFFEHRFLCVFLQL